MKKHLNESWIYRGMHYGPGTVDVPEELAKRVDEFEASAGNPAESGVVLSDSPQNTRPHLPPGGPDSSVSPPPDSTGIEDLGLTSEQVRALSDAGYTSREQLSVATDAELASIKGIGRGAIKRIREG